MKKSWVAWSAALLVGCLPVAHQDAKDGGSPGDEELPDVPQQSRRIGSTGGTLAMAGVEVRIPAGALSDETTLTLTVVDEVDALPALDDGLERDSRIVILQPHGTQFAQPVTITIPHDGRGRRVFRLADEADADWEPVADVSTSDVAATFQTQTFSYYVVTRPGLRRGETIHDYRVPIVPDRASGLPTQTAGPPLYDRGSAFWVEREEGRWKIWRLALDAGPGEPVLIASTPWPEPGLALSQIWITKNHVVWHLMADDRLSGLASVSKDGSVYRSDLPFLNPLFPRNEGLVSLDYRGSTGNVPDIYELSPATGGLTGLPGALNGLVREGCIHDAATNTLACVIGGLSYDGDGGYGVTTYDFQTGQRTNLGRSNNYMFGALNQNAANWFTASVSVPAGLMVWPKAGGEPRFYATWSDPAVFYAVDEESIYLCRGQELVQVSVSDFTETRLALDCSQVLGVDDSHIYFLGMADAGPHYLFKRLPKH